MNGEAKPISVHILDKEYLVGCPEDEREALVAASKFLDRKMREVRGSGKVIGTERIAVITALNIAHELLLGQGDHEALTKTIATDLARIDEKLSKALAEGDNEAQVV